MVCLTSYICDHTTDRNECLNGKKFVSIGRCFIHNHDDLTNLNDTCIPDNNIEHSEDHHLCRELNSSCQMNMCECLSDNCNKAALIEHRHYDQSESEAPNPKLINQTSRLLTYLLPVVCIFFIAIVAFFFCYRLRGQLPKKAQHEELTLLPQHRSPDDTTLETTVA